MKEEIFSCAYPSKEKEKLSLLISDSTWWRTWDTDALLLHMPPPRLKTSEGQCSGAYNSREREYARKFVCISFT